RTKLGAALASLTFVGAATALSSGPAQAVTPATPTTAQLTMDHQTAVKGQYHDLIGYLETTIDDDHGGGVYAGSADLQRRLPGHGWKTVKHDADGSDGIGFGSYGSHATGNVAYRIHYLGGTDPNTSITYAPSFSNTVVVTTLWKIKDTSGCPFNT